MYDSVFCSVSSDWNFSAVLFPIGSRQSWRSSKAAIALPFGESYNLETNHPRIGNLQISNCNIHLEPRKEYNLQLHRWRQNPKIQCTDMVSEWMCLILWKETAFYSEWFQIFFHVHPYLGKWSNLTNMFQMGWNQQLFLKYTGICVFWVMDNQRVCSFFLWAIMYNEDVWILQVKPSTLNHGESCGSCGQLR